MQFQSIFSRYNRRLPLQTEGWVQKMSQAAGTKIASYEIVAPPGPGEMSEVYRARDKKLNREMKNGR